jgi:hypothetical protein
VAKLATAVVWLLTLDFFIQYLTLGTSPAKAQQVRANSAPACNSKMGVVVQESHYVPGSQAAEHPKCPTCAVPMWLTRIEPDKADHDKRTFECKACGATVTEVVRWQPQRP